MLAKIEIPRQPTPELFHPLQWPKAAVVLSLLASGQTSVRFELLQLVAEQFGILPRGKSIDKMIARVADLGLTTTQKFNVIPGIHLVAIRLTERGKAYCESAGMEIVESEWERLLRLHSGDSQPRHTGAVLAFAFGARLRGWKVEVLPRVSFPKFYPDLRVSKGEERHYVEVELGTRKEAKWQLAQRAQGYVALCARSPESREALIEECADEQIYGWATDLRTLYETRDIPNSPLWVQKWSPEDNFSWAPVRFFSGSRWTLSKN